VSTLDAYILLRGSCGYERLHLTGQIWTALGDDDRGRCKDDGMRSRRQRRDTDRALRLLHAAFVQIRAAASSGDIERARRLADSFHNAPTMVIRDGDAEAMIASTETNCRRHGDTAVFDEMLRYTAD
jgi:hypothetical protein